MFIILMRSICSWGKKEYELKVFGFRLGLFAFEKKGEVHEFGSNCLPSLSVNSLTVLETKIEGKEVCFPLTRIKDNWVVEIIDSEGNHIEMTAPVV